MRSTELVEATLAEQAAYEVGCIWFDLCDRMAEALSDTASQLGMEIVPADRLVEMVRSEMLRELRGELVESAGLTEDEQIVEGLVGAAGKLASIVGNVLLGTAKLAGALGGGILKGATGEEDTMQAAKKLATGAGKLLGKTVQLAGKGLVGAGKLAYKGAKAAAPHVKNAVVKAAPYVKRGAQAAGRGVKAGFDKAKKKYQDKVAAGCPEGEKMVFGICRRVKQNDQAPALEPQPA